MISSGPKRTALLPSQTRFFGYPDFQKETLIPLNISEPSF